MKSTFSRAVIGFMMLTIALFLMALTALWAVETYAASYVWASVLVVLVALLTEVQIYSTTLHGPIYEWIREPSVERERRERAQNVD